MSDFIFYHIEKCGGSSLRCILYNYFSKIMDSKLIFIPEYSGNINVNYMPCYIDEIKRNPMFDFDNIKVILSHIRYYDFPNMNKSCKFKFTCIREPISRVISHYYYFSYNKSGIHLIDLPENDFEDYCTRFGCLIGDSLDLKNHNNNTIVIDERLKEFNYIAILENMDDDLLILNKLLNKYFSKNIKLDNIIKNVNKEVYIKESELLKKKMVLYCQNDTFIYERVKSMKFVN